jgi:hypothetical protein
VGEKQDPVISLTQQEIALAYLYNSRPVGEGTLQADEAIARPRSFYPPSVFTNMRESYYMQSSGVLLINFAYQQGDYICYSDLIKVGVALYDGSICP